MHNKYKNNGFRVVAVNCWNEDAKLLTTFARRSGVSYPILLNGSDVADDWGVKALPTNFLLDANGKVTREFGIIGTLDMPEVQKAIEALLQ